MFLTIKLCTHAKLNCFGIELIICLKMDLALYNLQRLKCHKPKQTNKQIIASLCVWFECHTSESNWRTHASWVRTGSTETTKKIHYTKGEGAVNHTIVTSWFQKFPLGLQEPWWSGKVRYHIYQHLRWVCVTWNLKTPLPAAVSLAPS